MASERQEKLAALFQETAERHHQAYIEDDGADPEWPLWYSDYLMGRIHDIVEKDADTFTRSEIVYLLVALDKEQRTNAPDAVWRDYYAEGILAYLGL